MIMTTYHHFMPLDRTEIKTRLRIHPDFLDTPNAYIHKHELQIRSSKPTRGMSKCGPTRKLTLDVLTYKGIKAKLRKLTGDPLTDVTIDFNPGVCLHGHNGAVLSLAGFLHALAILVTHLKPFLNDPEDWIDLIPGLRSGGVAYWSYLEIFLHYADPDGTLLACFRNAQGDNSQTPIRHWAESMVIGGKRSKLRFGFYRKAVEMVAHDKLPPEQLASYQYILRLEVRLKGDKLVQYLGNERNVVEIDEVQRLARFFPQDLLQEYRKRLSDLHGVFGSSEPLGTLKPKDQLIPLARLLARAALDPRTSHTFQELLAHTRFYTGASTDTMGKIWEAGIAELENLSAISKDELFSDEAYRTQPSVWSEKREKKVRHEFEDTFVHPLIYKAYRPPHLPFQPITQLPEYLRL
jgi:hypothetical protein